jgi:hypothetical protein
VPTPAFPVARSRGQYRASQTDGLPERRNSGIALHRENAGTTGPARSRGPQADCIKRSARQKCACTPFYAPHLVSFPIHFRTTAFDGRSCFAIGMCVRSQRIGISNFRLIRKEKRAHEKSLASVAKDICIGQYCLLVQGRKHSRMIAEASASASDRNSE